MIRIGQGAQIHFHPIRALGVAFAVFVIRCRSACALVDIGPQLLRSLGADIGVLPACRAYDPAFVGLQRISHALDLHHRDRSRGIAGLRPQVGGRGGDCGDDVGCVTTHPMRQTAPIGETGNVDAFRVDTGLRAQLGDNRLEESDVVDLLLAGRAAARVVHIPVTVDPVWKDRQELLLVRQGAKPAHSLLLLTVATGPVEIDDHRERCPGGETRWGVQDVGTRPSPALQGHRGVSRLRCGRRARACLRRHVRCRSRAARAPPHARIDGVRGSSDGGRQ